MKVKKVLIQKFDYHVSIWIFFAFILQVTQARTSEEINWLIFIYVLPTVLKKNSVGPLCKRFDERKVLIFVGILFMFLGRIIVFPIPGFDHPPLANSTAPESKTSASFLSTLLYKCHFRLVN